MTNRVTSKAFDVSGSGIPRIARHFLLYKAVPFGDVGGGPGFKHLGLATCVHLLGTPLAWAMLLFEARIQRAITLLMRLRRSAGKPGAPR